MLYPAIGIILMIDKLLAVEELMTFRDWGARPAALLLILIVKSMVVRVLGVLTVIILGDGALI